MAGLSKEIAFEATIDASKVVSTLQTLKAELSSMGDSAQGLVGKIDEFIAELGTGTVSAADFAKVIEGLKTETVALEAVAEQLNIASPIVEQYKAISDSAERVLVDGVVKSLEKLPDSATESVKQVAGAVDLLAQTGAEVPATIETAISALSEKAADLVAEVQSLGADSANSVAESIEKVLPLVESLGDVDAIAKFKVAMDSAKNALSQTTKASDKSADLMKELEAELKKVGAIDLEEKFDNIGEALSGTTEAAKGLIGSNELLASSIAGVSSVYKPTLEKLHAFGEVLEATGLKQKALAGLQEALNGAVMTAVQAYKESGNSVAAFAKSLFTAGNATKALKAGLVSTGIGALAVALGIVLANLDKIMAFVNEFIEKSKPLRAMVDVVLDFAATLGLAEKRELRDSRRAIADLDKEINKLSRDTEASAEGLEKAIEKEAQLREKQVEEYAKLMAQKRKLGEKVDDEDIEAAEKVVERTLELYDRQLEGVKANIDKRRAAYEALGVSTIALEEEQTRAEQENVEKRIELFEKYRQRGGQLTQQQQQELEKAYQERQQLEVRALTLKAKRIEEEANREMAGLDRVAKIRAADGQSTYAIEMKKLAVQREAVKKRIDLIMTELKAKQQLTEEDKKQLQQAQDQLAEIDAEMKAKAIERAREIRDAIREIQDSTVELLGAGAGELTSQLADIAKQSQQTAAQLERKRQDIINRFGKDSVVYRKYMEYMEQATVAATKRIERALQDVSDSITEIVRSSQQAVRDLDSAILQLQQGLLDLEDIADSPEYQKSVDEFFDAVDAFSKSRAELVSSGESLLLDMGSFQKDFLSSSAKLIEAYDRLQRDEIERQRKRNAERRKLASEQIEIERKNQLAQIDQQRQQLKRDYQRQEEDLENISKLVRQQEQYIADLREKAATTRDKRLAEEYRRQAEEGERNLEALRQQEKEAQAALEQVRSNYQKQLEQLDQQQRLVEQNAEAQTKKILSDAERQDKLSQLQADNRLKQMQLQFGSVRKYSEEYYRLQRVIVENEIEMAKLRGASSEEILGLMNKLGEIDKEKAIAPLLEINDTLSAVGEFSGKATEALGQFFDVFVKQGRASAAFKAFAVADVLAKTAQSLMNAVVVAQQGAIGTGVLAPFTFATFLASQIGVVLNAIAQVRQILDAQVEAPQMTPPEFDWGTAVANMQNALSQRDTMEDTGGNAPTDLRVYVLDSDIVGARSRNETLARASTIP